MVAEKRVRQRRKMEQRCWVALKPSEPLAECSLYDISASGAKLVLCEESKMPKKFDLYMTPDGRVGRQCEVAWQSGKEIGLRFVGRVVPHRESSETIEMPSAAET